MVQIQCSSSVLIEHQASVDISNSQGLWFRVLWTSSLGLFTEPQTQPDIPLFPTRRGRRRPVDVAESEIGPSGVAFPSLFFFKRKHFSHFRSEGRRKTGRNFWAIERSEMGLTMKCRRDWEWSLSTAFRSAKIKDDLDPPIFPVQQLSWSLSFAKSMRMKKAWVHDEGKVLTCSLLLSPAISISCSLSTDSLWQSTDAYRSLQITTVVMPCYARAWPRRTRRCETLPLHWTKSWTKPAPSLAIWSGPQRQKHYQ